MEKIQPKRKIKVSISTRYGTHLCILEPDEKHGYIVTAPALKGVITWGRDITHAKKMAKEAIELCIECQAEEALERTKSYARTIAREPLAV